MNPTRNRDESEKLKRFQDALKGRRLSGIAAHQINVALRGEGPYRELCSQEDKLPGIYKERLQNVVDCMISSGVKASASLLTQHQKKAVTLRNGGVQ